MKNVRNVVVVLALLAIFGCSKHSSNPAEPTPTPTPTPGSGSTSLETLPGERHYLIATDGSKTSMWTRLMNETTPVRGSTILVGPSACPSNCFQHLSLEVGLEGVPNPATTVRFNVGFSHDGVSVDGSSLTVISNNGTGNGTWHSDPSMIWAFPDKVKYLLVEASFHGDTNGQYGTFPSQSGSYSIVLDYN